jgi:hypothetical protein
MLSALVALGFHRPDELAAMVNPLGDGTFDITLPGKPTVNVRPEQGGGTDSEGNWAAAIESAALQFTNASADRVLSFGEGISLLTGNSRTAYRNASGVGFAPLTRFRRRREWYENRVHQATANSRVIVLGGSDGYWTDVKVDGLINRHCYALLQFEPEFGTCRIRDPRGFDESIPQGRKRDGYGPGEFWLTSEETEASFCGLSIED